MEKMEANYHERAVQSGALVVSACGFDSVPAELGLMFNSRQWVGQMAPNRIEAYLSLESKKKIVGNFGTFESAVLGVANADQLLKLRRSRPRKPRPQVRKFLQFYITECFGMNSFEKPFLTFVTLYIFCETF